MAKFTSKIVPHLWFDKEAREAVELYCSIFPDSEITSSKVIKDTPCGDCEFLNFRLAGQPFAAISAGPYFQFNEAISFIVNCDNQEEIDYYWEKLSAVPGAEQCGWIKDKFGVSWQIVPSDLERFLSGDDPAGVERASQALLGMKKLDIAQLEAAYRGP